MSCATKEGQTLDRTLQPKNVESGTLFSMDSSKINLNFNNILPNLSVYIHFLCTFKFFLWSIFSNKMLISLEKKNTLKMRVYFEIYCK